jgi:8-oxo-dGTP pyrophosphatase MutT (NUDIX family)
MRIGDLEELVTFHDQLNPDIWEEGGLMKPEVRLALFRIAKAFVKFINVPDLRLTDITISGSNAAYNYTRHSDIDLHLIADASGPCEVDLKELFLAKKGLFNDQHDILIYGHEVEVYVQLNTDPHISNGIFSLYNNRWIKEPEQNVAKPDVTNVEEKFKQLKHDIDQGVKSNDAATIDKLRDKIKKMRQSGLERTGEMSPENLAFKLLRNMGDIEKLWDAGQAAHDRELSLEEGNAFSGALAAARASGASEFTVDGKVYKVKKSRKKAVKEDNDAEHRAALEKTGFWGKQGAGCIFVAKDSGKFCIAHRSGSVEQPNTWGTWGGAIDSGEDPESAAAREVREEAGWNGKFNLLPMFVFSHHSGFRYSNFLAVVETEFTPQLNWESQGFTWVEYGDWPQPLHPGLAALLNDPASQKTMLHFAKHDTDK